MKKAEAHQLQSARGGWQQWKIRSTKKGSRYKYLPRSTARKVARKLKKKQEIDLHCTTERRKPRR